MQRAIAVRFGRGDVVIEFMGNRLPQAMHGTEHLIANRARQVIFLFAVPGRISLNIRGVNDDPQRLHVVDLFNVHALAFHFAVDGIDMLGPAHNGCLDPKLLDIRLQQLNRLVDYRGPANPLLIDL